MPANGVSGALWLWTLSEQNHFYLIKPSLLLWPSSPLSLLLSRCLHMALWPAKGASIYDVCTRGGRGSWKSRRGNGAQEGRLRENVDKVEGVTNFANIIDERPLRSALSLWRQLWSNNSLAPFPSFAFRFIHRTEKNVSLPFWMSLAGAAGYVSVPKPLGKNSTWEVDMLFTSLYNSWFIIHNSQFTSRRT